MNIGQIWSIGSDEQVIDLLDKGFVPNPNRIVGYCRAGNVKMVTKLLQYPADVIQGAIAAAYTGHIDVLDQLYITGLDVNFRTKYNDTILHYYVNDNQTLRWLLDRGCNPNAVDACLGTPLHNLVYNHPDLDMIATLFNYGAVQLPDEDGNTPLHLACSQQNSELATRLVTKLVNNGPIQVKNKEGWTPLHFAYFKGNIGAIDILLHNGATETCNNEGKLPSDLLRGH